MSDLSGLGVLYTDHADLRRGTRLRGWRRYGETAFAVRQCEPAWPKLT